MISRSTWAALPLLCVALLASTSEQASALPRMSLTAGSPCATCHVSPSGGGMRNELGFTSMNKVAMVNFSDMGLQALHDQETNRLFNLVSAGADVRYQGVRLGIPTPNESGDVEAPDFEIFQMQVQPYLAVHPTEWLTVSGSYSFGEGDNSCQDTWPGTTCYTAEAVVAPDPSLPTVRGGMIMPSIGIRHDDHTILTRNHALRQPLVPSNYAEWGGEIAYQPVSWIRAEAGVYDQSNLDDLLNSTGQTADLGDVAYLGRVQWLPQTRISFGGDEGGGDEFADDFDDFDAEPEAPFAMTLNGWLGASAYSSGDYLLTHFFAGVGSDIGTSLQVEHSRSSRKSQPEGAPVSVEIDTQATSLILSHAWFDWLVTSGRVEMAKAEFPGNNSVDTTQYVASLEWFPLPFVEIRPEYRLIDNDIYRFGQTTVQLHLFY